MNKNQNDPNGNFRIDVSTEHNKGMITVKGLVENKSDNVVCLKELTALHKNFDGFVVELDKMVCAIDLPSGETFPFRFPERSTPINCYTCEVVVSKFQVKEC